MLREREGRLKGGSLNHSSVSGCSKTHTVRSDEGKRRVSAPNDQLRRARERCDSPSAPGQTMTRQDLADLVNAWLWEHTNRQAIVDANYIGKLERGLHRWPNDAYRAALRSILGAATDGELGFYRPARPARRAGTVADVKQEEFSVSSFGIGISAVPLARSLLYEVESVPIPTAIGKDVIDEVKTFTRGFTDLDNRHGGELVLEAATAQLKYSLQLLDIPCPPRLRDELFSSVGHFAGVVAFMHVDAYAHGNADRMFRLALACAEEANDWHLRAEVLTKMARQAFWRGDPDAAVTRTEMALIRTDRLSLTQRAMLLAVRARALARLGKANEAICSVGEADDAFYDASPKDPGHISWYTAAEHKGETGSALSDLIAHHFCVSRASVLLNSAIADNNTYARSRFLSEIRLASLEMATGDPRHAAEIGEHVIMATRTMRSRRFKDELRDLERLSASHARVPVVASLRRHISSVMTST